MKKYSITDSNGESICVVDADNKREARDKAIEAIHQAIEDKHKECETLGEYLVEIAQAKQTNIEEI